MEQRAEERGTSVCYEYKEVQTAGAGFSMLLDSYGAFGWELDETAAQRAADGSTLYLKRDRGIKNRPELTRLQQNFEDCLRQIGMLEKSKTANARRLGLLIGVCGTVFLALAVFAVTADPPAIWLCVLSGIPGLAGWIAPIFLYRLFVAKRTEAVAPLIGEMQGEIRRLCERGSRLLC